MSAAIGKQTPAADLSPNTATPATPTAPQVRRKTQPLGLNAKRVISKRYSLKDAKGRALEEWPDIVRRVVGHVSAAEKDAQKRDEFFAAMSDVMPAERSAAEGEASGGSRKAISPPIPSVANAYAPMPPVPAAAEAPGWKYSPVPAVGRAYAPSPSGLAPVA